MPCLDSVSRLNAADRDELVRSVLDDELVVDVANRADSVCELDEVIRVEARDAEVRDICRNVDCVGALADIDSRAVAGEFDEVVTKAAVKISRNRVDNGISTFAAED